MARRVLPLQTFKFNIMSGNSKSYTASLRAPEGYHLPNAMVASQAVDEVFDKFGGHPCAAGFTVLTKAKLTKAKKLMEKELAGQGVNMSANNTSYNLTFDEIPEEMQLFQYRREVLWVQETQIDVQFLAEIMSMDPFGQDFMLPNLAFQVSSQTLGSIKWLGAEQKHLKLTSGNGISFTFFNLEPEIKQYFIGPKKTALWIITKPIQNCWQNKRTIELVVDKWFLAS
jgi:single-stranded DNA-specific DHH superfamily exonuclease